MRSLALLCGAIGALIVLAFCGCAAKAPLRVGHTYFVQWPGVPMDVVTVEQRYRHDVVYCRSVKDRIGWVCNFRMALFWTPAQMAPAPDTLRVLTEGDRP